MFLHHMSSASLITAVFYSFPDMHLKDLAKVGVILCTEILLGLLVCQDRKLISFQLREHTSKRWYQQSH